MSAIKTELAVANSKFRPQPCPHCGAPVRVGCVTCLRSECQEAEYHANIGRNRERRGRAKGRRIR